ncbi:hypothetical protein THAOC_04418 [Thalassiosira oceanica]|uniref:Uncharacterized protein n=1 Tax=Thalassiosira oceanica TaxID=159749 RepID=K0TNX4_THAOC|nr:hypothetical protein THAOC_04418 [Thalassiosira oceanica]|eukprot:EJK73937.1 hypothetical protein THAOC_04418 [Thalassiosira oceanica]
MHDPIPQMPSASQARPPTLLHCIANGWRVFCRLIVAWRLIFDGYSTACHHRAAAFRAAQLLGLPSVVNYTAASCQRRSAACMSEYCRKAARWSDSAAMRHALSSIVQSAREERGAKMSSLAGYITRPPGDSTPAASSVTRGFFDVDSDSIRADLMTCADPGRKRGRRADVSISRRTPSRGTAGPYGWAGRRTRGTAWEGRV